MGCLDRAMLAGCLDRPKDWLDWAEMRGWLDSEGVCCLDGAGVIAWLDGACLLDRAGLVGCLDGAGMVIIECLDTGLMDGAGVIDWLDTARLLDTGLMDGAGVIDWLDTARLLD